MRYRERGLTLVELMVTLAVAIILLAVGMPLFSSIAANNRAVAEANLFLSGFKMARSEAVKRGATVSVCAIADPSASPLTCSSTNSDWSNGLLVFTDSSTPGSVDGTDVIVKAFVNPTTGSQVASARTFFTYEAMGEVNNLSNHSLCPDSGTPVERSCLQLGRSGTTGSPVRCLHLRRSGQTRLERDSCS